MLMTGILGDTY